MNILYPVEIIKHIDARISTEWNFIFHLFDTINIIIIIVNIYIAFFFEITQSAVFNRM